MLWGGLRPIASRVVLDIVTLACLAFCALFSAHEIVNGILLIASILIHLVTTNLTNRWTVALPMVPFAALQLVRRFSIGSLGETIIAAVSLSLLAVAAALCVFFPAVELAPLTGKYNVGVVDLFLPVIFMDSLPNNSTNADGPSQPNNGSTTNGDSNTDNDSSNYHQGYVTARLLYPTRERPDWIPLLNPKLSKEFCKQCMKAGAPPPLKNCAWILHTWRLTKIPLKRNAELAVNPGEPLPMVVYSHGLGGNSSFYSYQCMMLAASGAVVLTIDHTDGSAPVVLKQDGSRVLRDHSVGKLFFDGKMVEYLRARRSLTSSRAKEFLAAAEALLRLNNHNIPELETVGISFVDQLNPRQLHFAGHSFGAATALTAGKRRPDLPRSILAHDPAMEWMPDDARRAFFDENRLLASELTYDGGRGGYEEESESTHGQSAALSDLSIHNIDMLFLYSAQSIELGVGESQLVEKMKEKGVLERQLGVCEFGIISDAKHYEFSDTSMLTPVWLARPLGMTGKRNPLDTAEEIARRTISYLESIK